MLYAVIGGLAVIGIAIFALVVIHGETKTVEVHKLSPAEERSYELK